MALRDIAGSANFKVRSPSSAIRDVLSLRWALSDGREGEEPVAAKSERAGQVRGVRRRRRRVWVRCDVEQGVLRIEHKRLEFRANDSHLEESERGFGGVGGVSLGRG